MIVRVTQTPTVTAGVYSAGDAVGGLLTFAGVGYQGYIRNVMVLDDAGQDVDYDLVLFTTTIAGTADNGAFDPTDAELATLTAVVLADTNKSFSDNGLVQPSGITETPYTTSGGTLFGQLVTRGTPTYAATDDVTVVLVVDKVNVA